jgi:hypothetical protein
MTSERNATSLSFMISVKQIFKGCMARAGKQVGHWAAASPAFFGVRFSGKMQD